MNDLEVLSAQIHEVYCKYHKDIKGEEYRTNGDYLALREDAKEADRYIARFILAREESLQEKLRVAIETLEGIVSEHEGYCCEENHDVTARRALEKIK